MQKTGGIISIIAGVFAVIAAFVTLLFGGFASAFHANGASTVVGLGWGGVFFSFSVIVFGSLAFSKPKLAGQGVIASSILGMVLGGTLVAIFMALSFVGGILCLLGAKKEQNINPAQAQVTDLNSPILNVVQTSETVSEQPKAESKSTWKKSIAILFSVLVLLAIVGQIVKTTSRGAQSVAMTVDERKLAIEQLVTAEDSKLLPKTFTEWADVENGSNDLYDQIAGTRAETSVQKQKRKDELQRNLISSKGKIVIWQLIVGDITGRENGYLLKNKCKAPGPKLFLLQQEQPNLEASLFALNSEDKKAIESLGSCAVVKIKGKISGHGDDGKIYLDPAILVESSSFTATGIKGFSDGQRTDVTTKPVEPETTQPSPVITPTAASNAIEGGINVEEKVGTNNIDGTKEPQSQNQAKAEERTLSELDTELNKTYKMAMSLLDATKKGDLKRQEIAWIRAKDQECGVDQECLKRATEKRLDELRQLISIK